MVDGGLAAEPLWRVTSNWWRVGQILDVECWMVDSFRIQHCSFKIRRLWRGSIRSELAFPFCEGNDLLPTTPLLCHQGAHHFSDVSAKGLQNGGSMLPNFFNDFILHFLVLQKVLSGCK
jgi:hypothetical protein